MIRKSGDPFAAFAAPTAGISTGGFLDSVGASGKRDARRDFARHDAGPAGRPSARFQPHRLPSDIWSQTGDNRLFGAFGGRAATRFERAPTPATGCGAPKFAYALEPLDAQPRPWRPLPFGGQR